jgi:hypothetical protein
MSAHERKRRPGTGGDPGDPAGSKINGSSVPATAVVLGLDHDGVVQLCICAIVAIAGRALERGHDAEAALAEVLDLARKIESLWLTEQVSEVSR